MLAVESGCLTMAENYKHLYEQMKKMVELYQDEIVPQMREQLEKRVEVVRCKDCTRWKKQDFQGGNDINHLEYGGRCPISNFARYESDYCSRGERKENE